MLGRLRNYPVAEITYRTGGCCDWRHWHLAIHHNDNHDTIEYRDFINKAEAIKYALLSGVKIDDVYQAKYENGLVDGNDVVFTCFTCGSQFSCDGGVLDYRNDKRAICGECISIIETNWKKAFWKTGR